MTNISAPANASHPPARALGLLPRRGQPLPPATRLIAGPLAFTWVRGRLRSSPIYRSPSCIRLFTSSTPMRSPPSAANGTDPPCPRPRAPGPGGVGHPPRTEAPPVPAGPRFTIGAVQTVRLEAARVLHHGRRLRDPRAARGALGNAANQSLAEATPPPAARPPSTTTASPRRSICSCRGWGLCDWMAKSPGARGRLRRDRARRGAQAAQPPCTQLLVLLCCCAPAYSHDDTVLTGG